MPLPLILGIGAGIAGVVGVGSGIHGGVKMKDANDTIKMAKNKQERAIHEFETWNKDTNIAMDDLGKTELEILSSFDDFADLIGKIQNKPDFASCEIKGVDIPEYQAEELRKVSVGAEVALGGLGGAAVGTAGGFAAAGAATNVVMLVGTASTGTAISSLSGAAATNAALAALGGGAIGSAPLAGGMALGSTILGATTLGVGLLVGGTIFNITGVKLSDKADEAYRQATKTENEVSEIVDYLKKLKKCAVEYFKIMKKVNAKYKEHMRVLDYIVNYADKTDWVQFTEKEKLTLKNTVLLVGLLYEMCKVKLVLKSEKENEKNEINEKEINYMQVKAENLLKNQFGEAA